MTKKIPNEIRTEIETLSKELNNHSYWYYVLDSPIISDAEYDRQYRRLKELEEKYNYALPDSPTQRIGAPSLEKFEKVRHKEPMLSLDNAFSHDEVREFDRRIRRLLGNTGEIEYTVEPKYDGLAIELTYKNGLLSRGATRGDGSEGEDVTLNIRTVKSVPLRIEGNKIPEEIDIRGEIYMDIEEFEKLNRERERRGESAFANPRNAAAGAVRQLDPLITAQRKLYLACYGIGTVKGMAFKTHVELIAWLREARFPTPAKVDLTKGIERAIDAIRKIEEQRGAFTFEIDGAVIKVNDITTQRELGGKDKRAPLGDSLQISGASRYHKDQRNSRQRWKNRRDNALRRF
jgi:DNA ligase (NAD+)